MAKKANIAASVGIDGEREFRQAITNINSDMKVLTSEMKKVTSEFVDNAKSVDALTAKDKVLSEQVDKQKDKIEALRKAMENSKDQYPDNIKKLNDYKSSLNTAEAKLFDMTHEVDKNKQALEEAKTPTVQLAKEVTDLGKAADKTGGHTLKMGDIIKANLISAAIINGIKQLASAIKDIAMQSISAADEIAAFAGQTGFSTDEIQKWQYVGKGLDVELETITGSISKLTRAMTSAKDGAGAQSDAFKELGVAVVGSDGKLRDSKTVMLEAFNALNKVGNETERDSLALILFGKSALELNPLIKAGSAEINKLSKAAEKNGAIMSKATIEGLDQFKDSTEMLNQEIQAMTGELMVELMPAFNELIQWFRDNKEEIKEFGVKVIGSVADGLQWIIDNKQSVVDGLGFILGAFVALKVIEGINLLVGTFNLLLASGSIGLAVIAIAGLVAALAVLVIYWDDIASAIHNAFDWLNKYLGLDKTKKGSASMQTGVYTSSATQSGYSVAREFIPKNAKPLVDWNAEGGIFTKPTIFSTPSGYQGVGDVPEVIMPLSRLSSMLNLNTQPSISVPTLKQALSEMRIDMGKDGFARFVKNEIIKVGT